MPKTPNAPILTLHPDHLMEAGYTLEVDSYDGTVRVYLNPVTGDCIGALMYRELRETLQEGYQLSGEDVNAPLEALHASLMATRLARIFSNGGNTNL